MHNVNMANNVTKQNAIKQLTLRISSETMAFIPAYAKSGGFRLRFAYNLSICLRFCQRSLPRKNSARVPGPEWAPMTGPT